MQRKTENSAPSQGASSGGRGAERPWAASDAASIESLTRGLVEHGEVSAVVALVASPRRILSWSGAGGYEGPHDARTPDLDARFDWASLTKPVVATLALELDRLGLLALTARVGRHWPDAPGPLRRYTLASLLRHRAGLMPWMPLRLRCRTPAEVAPCILASGIVRDAPAGRPPATYSDLGFILWGLTAERVLGVDLATLIARHVTVPLGMGGVGPAPGDQRDVVACLLDNAVERRLAAGQGLNLPEHMRPARGEVQDGNARFLGGLAGHAGLFGSARALWRFAAAWMGEAPAIHGDHVGKALAGRGRYALGWERRRRLNSAGLALSADSFGHTGFVGNSLWIDPERQRLALLLSHRRSSNGDFHRVRRAFHALAVRA